MYPADVGHKASVMSEADCRRRFPGIGIRFFGNKGALAIAQFASRNRHTCRLFQAQFQPAGMYSSVGAGLARYRRQAARRAITLSSMRILGVRSLDVECACGNEAVVDVSAMDSAAEVPALKNRLRCSICGSRPMFVRPNWQEMRAPGMGRRPTMGAKPFSASSVF